MYKCMLSVKRLLSISLLLMLSLLAGCGADSQVDLVYSETEAHSHHAEDLSVELTLLDRFQQPSDVFLQGEAIELVLSVTNHTDDVLVLDFDTGQQYDFYVDAWFGEVWAWSENKSFAAGSSHLDIPPRSTVSVSEFVDSDQFNRGNYTATGMFVSQGLTASVDFRVD